jgi:hypothetical protein
MRKFISILASLCLVANIYADVTQSVPWEFLAGSSLKMDSGVTTTFSAGSTVNATGATLIGFPGGGNVSNSGTPTAGQLAAWVDSTHIQGITANGAAVGLGSVTNDAQTKSAIMPNTAPAAGQFPVGNAGGTAYAPVTLSGSGVTATMSSAGVLTLSAIPNSTLSNSSMTIAGTATSLGGSISLDTIIGVSSNGYLKRTAANTLTNVASIPNADLANSGITIAGTSTSLGGSISLDTITGVSSNGFLKRTGANTLTNDTSTYITSVPVGATIYVDAINGTSGGARGNASKPFDTISHAIAVAVSGDIIEVGPGTFVENSGIVLPNGVSLNGQGKFVTIITSTLAGPPEPDILVPGNNSVISNLSVHASGAGTGCIGSAVDASQPNFTGAILVNVEAFAPADCIYIKSQAATLSAYHCNFSTNQDCVTLIGTTSPTVTLYDCTISTDGSGGLSRGIVNTSTTSTVYVYGGSITTNKGTATLSDAIVSSATAYLFNVVLIPTNATTDIVQTGGTLGTLNVAKLDGTAPTTSGTITLLSRAAVRDNNLSDLTNVSTARTNLAIGANPTGTIGLAAVNGAANTMIRSDGAPPLSQAIAPTWTGLHVFHQGIDNNGASITATTAAINTTETVLVKTPALTASRLVAGTVFRVTLIGTCTSSVANASTFAVRYGTNGTTGDALLATFTTPTAGTLATNVPFRAVIEITILTTGASATSYGAIQITTQTGGIIGAVTAATGIPTMTAINTTTANAILSVTYKSAATTTTSTFQEAFTEFAYK